MRMRCIVQMLRRIQRGAETMFLLTDGVHLLADSSQFIQATASIDMPVILPCRTTHPDITVRLFIQGAPISDSRATGMSFDSREGITISSVRPHEIIKCRADKADGKSEVKYVAVTLQGNQIKMVVLTLDAASRFYYSMLIYYLMLIRNDATSIYI
jgi:hypothetical protein